jgi:hypothetical protein
VAMMIAVPHRMQLGPSDARDATLMLLLVAPVKVVGNEPLVYRTK